MRERGTFGSLSGRGKGGRDEDRGRERDRYSESDRNRDRQRGRDSDREYTLKQRPIKPFNHFTEFKKSSNTRALCRGRDGKDRQTYKDRHIETKPETRRGAGRETDTARAIETEIDVAALLLVPRSAPSPSRGIRTRNRQEENLSSPEKRETTQESHQLPRLQCRRLSWT